MGIRPKKQRQDTEMLPRFWQGLGPMTASHKAAEYFRQRGKFCTEFPRLSYNQKVINKRYFYPQHMKN